MEKLLDDCCPSFTSFFSEDDEIVLGTDNMSIILIEINLDTSDYIKAKKKVVIPDNQEEKKADSAKDVSPKS